MTSRAASETSVVRPLARPVRRPRDELVIAWLLLLLDRGPTYGYELCRELNAVSIGIDSSALYRTLRRLEGERLVSSRWTSSSRGPRRRSYVITLKGRRRLDELAEIIRSARDVHDSFLEAHAQGRARGLRDSAA